MSAHFIDYFQIKRDSCVSVAGSGGKSTLICRIAREAVSLGWPVVVTTTTHIHLPFYSATERLSLCDERSLREFSPDDSMVYPQIIVSSKISPQKASGFQPSCLTPLVGKCLLLIEADGSRCKPFKIPAEYEPVIHELTTHTILVVGLTALGKPVQEDLVHRISLLEKNLHNSFITPELVAHVLTKHEHYVRKIPPTSQIMVYLAGCQNEIQNEYASQIKGCLRQKGFDWPVLAGNISPDLSSCEVYPQTSYPK